MWLRKPTGITGNSLPSAFSLWCVFMLLFDMCSCVACFFFDFLISVRVWRVFFNDLHLCSCVAGFFLWLFDICSCVACIFQWFAFVFMCGAFFCFDMCSCVACVFQRFSCVFMCGVFFQWLFDTCSYVACVFQWFSCVFMRGACFPMIFLCVHVWCAFHFLSRSPKKKQTILQRGLNLLQIPLSTCYIFLPSPPRYKIIQIMVY